MKPYQQIKTRRNAIVASAPSVAITLAKVTKLEKDAIIHFNMASDHDAATTLAGINEFLSDIGADKFEAVAGSVFPIDKNARTYAAALKAKTVSLPYNDENLKNKLMISANVFKDESDDTMWRVQGSGESARIVQVSDEDQTEILRNVYNSSAKLALASSFDKTVVLCGDMCAFYNEASAEVEFGIAVDATETGYKLVTSKDKEVIEVVREAILAMTETEVGDYVATASDAVSALQEYINYTRSLYNEKNEYITALESLLKTIRKA